MKNNTTPRLYAETVAANRPNQPEFTTEYVTTAFAITSATVAMTKNRSTLLPTNHDRVSRVSNTSLSATRAPLKKRVENHKNSGMPSAESWPRLSASDVSKLSA